MILKYSDDVYKCGELSGLRKKMSYIALKLKDPAEHSPSSPPPEILLSTEMF